MKLFENSSTLDIVIYALTAMVVFVTVLITTVTLIAKLLHPEMDVANANELVSSITNTALGALVGFIGGRAAGRLEAQNGAK